MYAEPRKNSSAKRNVIARFVDKPAHAKIAVQIALFCKKHSSWEKTSFTDFEFLVPVPGRLRPKKVYREVSTWATFFPGSISPYLKNPERTAAPKIG